MVQFFWKTNFCTLNMCSNTITEENPEWYCSFNSFQRGEDPIMTEFQIYALDANSLRVSVCRDTKDFTNQQGRGKFQVCCSAAHFMIHVYRKE